MEIERCVKITSSMNACQNDVGGYANSRCPVRIRSVRNHGYVEVAAGASLLHQRADAYKMLDGGDERKEATSQVVIVQRIQALPLRPMRVSYAAGKTIYSAGPAHLADAPKAIPLRNLLYS